MGPTPKCHFVPRLSNGSPKIVTTGVLVTSRAHNFVCKPSIQYIPLVLNLESPLSNIYNQVSPSGIQLDSPLGEKTKQEVLTPIIIHTHQKFKGGGVFPNIKPIL